MRQHFVLTLIGLMLVALLGLTAIGLADKGEWVFETIEPPDAVVWTGIGGINERGQVVVGYIDGSGVWHSFLLDGDTSTTISHPDASTTEGFDDSGTNAIGINDRGQIVGRYCDSNGTVHGFLLDGDTFTTIDVPDATWCSCLAINARGQIVGDYCGSSEPSRHRAYLFDGSTFILIDAPDAVTTVAWGINDRGQIVGEYMDASEVWHGFLLDGETFTTIDVPGAVNTCAYGINDRGQIVGHYWSSGDYYGDGESKDHYGFLLDGDTFSQIAMPGAWWTFVYSINNQGQIVGSYRNSDIPIARGFIAEQSHKAAPSLSSHSKALTTWAHIKAQ